MPDPQKHPEETVARLTEVFSAARPMHAARLALRTRSSVAREALARSLPGADLTDNGLLCLALAEELPPQMLRGRQARVLAALALTWAGQYRGGVGLEAAALAYRALWADGPRPDLPPAHHLLAAQTLLLTGRTEEVRRMLPLLTRLPTWAQPFLDADLAHPHRGATRGSSPAEHAAWEALLSQPFTRHGFSPVRVGPAEDGAHLFDRLSVPGVAASSSDGPLVTVIMPCFRPDEGLMTSVASVLAQSHGPLQVLLIDDASGPESEHWFERAAALDDRVQLVRRATNGGTYLARNAGLRHVAGDYVTFQDADDWTHPERIATQVALLTKDPSVPACRAMAVRVHDDLTHQWLGYRADRVNASSLMVRTTVVHKLGDFARVRKGADSEYTERIVTTVGKVGSTGAPLGYSRLRAGSLSRGDLAYQWTAPERLTFKGTYRAWHRQDRREPFPAPLPFVRGIDQWRTGARVDTAFVADFSADPAVDPGRAGKVWDLPSGWSSVRTALWHLERPWDVVADRPEMHERWFDRIVAGPTWQALARTEPVHADRVVVLEPSVLLLQGDQECAVTTGRVQVHLLPEDEALAPDVEAVVRRWFGVGPEWVRSG